jgi:ApaG protein
VTIENRGTEAAQLLDRHWVITDTNGKVQEVRGEGVVGEKPYLKPGQSFRYTSGTLLETPVGSMYGSYGMIADDGTRFDAEIPPFSLAIPKTLH